MSHSEHPHQDLRVVRTRKLLQEALIDLTTRHGFAAVTVRDITNHAHVNRATFYRHYRDKFDMVDQLVQDVYELLDQPDARPAGSGTERDSAGTAGVVRMYEHIGMNARFYQAMLGQNGDPAFAEKIRYYIQKRVRLFLPEAVARDQRLVDLYLRYVSSASVGIIGWWLNQGMPYTPAEMAEITYQLSLVDLQAVLVARE